ncbi:MAG: hypothetical protein K2X29_05480 [Candidatus Obscuribacterales bacterium]|nr:hypothetical protein [Candidatus Obscuribacterales bacterium]
MVAKITVNLDDNTSAHFDKLKKNLKSTGDEADHLGSKIKGMSSGAIAAIGGIVSVAGGLAVLKTLDEALKFNDEMEESISGLQAQTGMARDELEAYVASLQKASDYSLSFTEATQAVAKGVGSGFLSLEETTKVVEYASLKAKTSGEETAAVVDKLTQGLVLGSTESLQAAGLLAGGVDGVAAKYDMLRQEGEKSFDELTRGQKKLLVTQEALSQIEDLTEIYKTVGLQGSDSIDEMKHATDELYKSFAEVVGSSEFSDYMQRVADIIQEYVIPAVQGIPSALETVNQTIEVSMSSLAESIGLIAEGSTDALKESYEEEKRIRAEQKKAAQEEEKIRDEAAKKAKEMQDARKAEIEAAKEWHENEKKLQKEKMELEKQLTAETEKQKKLAEEAAKLELENAQKAIEAEQKKLDAKKKALDETKALEKKAEDEVAGKVSDEQVNEFVGQLSRKDVLKAIASNKGMDIKDVRRGIQSGEIDQEDIIRGQVTASKFALNRGVEDGSLNRRQAQGFLNALGERAQAGIDEFNSANDQGQINDFLKGEGKKGSAETDLLARKRQSEEKFVEEAQANLDVEKEFYEKQTNAMEQLAENQASQTQTVSLVIKRIEQVESLIKANAEGDAVQKAKAAMGGF